MLARGTHGPVHGRLGRVAQLLVVWIGKEDGVFPGRRVRGIRSVDGIARTSRGGKSGANRVRCRLGKVGWTYEGSEPRDGVSAIENHNENRAGAHERDQTWEKWFSAVFDIERGGFCDRQSATHDEGDREVVLLQSFENGAVVVAGYGVRLDETHGPFEDGGEGAGHDWGLSGVVPPAGVSSVPCSSRWSHEWRCRKL